MFEFLKNQKLPIVLAVLGFLLVIAGFFQITDITKLAITANSTPIYSVAAIGIALLVASVGLSIVEKRQGALPRDLNQQPKPIKQGVFLSAPMSAFVTAGDPDGYKKSRDEILKVIAALKRECRIEDVFYAGEGITDVSKFDLPGASLKDDFRRIQEREYFILSWPEKFASRSSLLEAGIALALNRKCIYFIRDEDDLPFLLKGAQNVTRNVKILKYEKVDDLLNTIRINREKLFDFEKLG